MLHENIAGGIHLFEQANVNCYIVQDEGGFMLVDAGLPAMWKPMMAALARLGHRPGEASALVLTHAHFDHVGFAARLQREHGVPVYVHPGDAYLAAHPYRYRHERNRLFYPLRYPRCIPLLGRMALAGALNVKGVETVAVLHEGPAPDLPGKPVVIHTPGHTDGHCALHFPDRDTIVTGDALVTLDPYTGFTGPHIVSAAATADTRTALASLSALAATGARMLLPGHGEPDGGGIAAAVDRAVARGAT
ncbi:MBL fold metallo-hydrolase [Arthrobacter sp. GCM10027362]|uniref:MBL fold metallo-hydrolase n=1 Tax=Arthrobacter sp. GCM10027362 TaxID=3273379 RepID=UPI00362CC93A